MTSHAPAVKIGDHVLINITLLGQSTLLEVVVVQIDDELDRGVRIIGRPEGSLVSAFAAYEWCAV